MFELNTEVDPDEFRKANLIVLDAGESKVVVAFASDPQMAGFFERLKRYQTAEIEEGKQRPLFGFFDALEGTRPLTPEEKLTHRLREGLAEIGREEVRLDVECWHPGEGEVALAATWLGEVEAAVERVGGRVADRYLNAVAGLALARVYIPGTKVLDIATLDQVARVDLLPQLLMWPADVYTAGVEDMPTVESPGENSPIVGLVDSGVLSGHPLIGPALEGVEVLDGLFPDGEDEDGHGTRIASLILHGRVDEALARNVPLRPFCRVLSVRVLDADHQFPKDILWEHQLEDAIRYCASRGAVVVNVSLGDDGSIYRAPRAAPVAALLDQLARELQLVIVVSAGNIAPASYLEMGPEVVGSYPMSLRDAQEAAIIDPAPAALALTVGALSVSDVAGAAAGAEVVSRSPLGRIGWPAPFSRHGPGIAGAIKPELSAPGGSLAYDHDLATIVMDPELQLVAAGGGNAQSRSRRLEICAGTSYATPLVTRVAAAVLNEHPDASPNLVRALVLQSRQDPVFAEDLIQGTESERRQLLLDLVGYGSPDIADAIASRDHRAVLIAHQSIPMNGVHIYEVPIPQSFFESGGTREVSITLCFDPPTRARRLDYLASRMEFHLLRGVDQELLERLVLAASSEELEQLDEMVSEGEDGEGEGTEGPGTLSKLSTKQLIRLQPSATRRAMGANQMGLKGWSQKLRAEDGEKFLLVIKNTNRWDDDGAMQNYAVVATLTRDEDHADLYAELEAELRVEVEIEAQI